MQIILNGYAILDEQNVKGEPRLSVVGYTDSGRPLTILFTLRREKFRPFTGWDAERDEEELYWIAKGV